ncbi:MAG: pyridoxal phosphate-dependent aminotransferase [Erysipelotrichaceae bacterium]|nr:pyridoxal phosphate-dependent aminotransferase [Erysipelotrichaceae bacterium]
MYTNKRFKDVKGGLFDKVTKADVGDGVSQLMANGYTMMSWADPFFPNPYLSDHLKQLMIDEIQNGPITHYTMPIGDKALREVIAQRIKKKYDVDIDPSRNVIVTPGSDSGLYLAMIPFLEEGDEVLIPDPSYPSNFLNVKLCGAKAVSVPLYAENNYQLDINEFEKRVNDHTKMVVITHPNNPTTTVFNRKSIEDLCSFVKKHNLLLVCDQAFEDHIYDNREMIAPMELIFDQTITVFSISKGLGLSGLRVGYVVACDKIMDVLYGCAVNIIGATNTLSQKVATDALMDDQLMNDIHIKLEKRRDMAYDILSTIPHTSIKKSESGILSWLDVSRLGTSQEVAQYLLDNAHVSINEGSHYGKQGEGYIRIVHACLLDDEDAKNTLLRIKDCLTDLDKQIANL